MKLLYKLAKDNLKRNKEIYLPYLFVFIGSISVFFLIMNLSFNNNLIANIEEYKHLESIVDISLDYFTEEDYNVFLLGMEYSSFKDILLKTSIVVIIITLIFNLYSTNYILKRRLKDYGVYNVMGMDESFIKKLIILEISILNLLGIIIGIVLGIILDRLNFLIIFKVLDFTGFSTNNISMKIIFLTILMFILVTLISFVFIYIKMKNMKSLDLIYKREVKTRSFKYDLIFSILGIVLIVMGYYLSLKNNVSYHIINNKELELRTIITVILFIVFGTFMLFQGVTVGIINILKKNKVFFKKKRNFIAISNLRYRLRANAVALASICILGLMVLLSISFTINTCLGFMTKEKRMDLSMSVSKDEEVKILKNRIVESIKKYNLDIEDYYNMELILGLTTSEEDEIKILKNQTNKYRQISLVKIEDFNNDFAKKEKIDDYETIVLSNYLRYKEEIDSDLLENAEIFNEKLKVKKIYNIDYDMSLENMGGDYIFVVSDVVYKKIENIQEEHQKKYMYSNDDGDYIDEDGNIIEPPRQLLGKEKRLLFKFSGKEVDKRAFIRHLEKGESDIFTDELSNGVGFSSNNKYSNYNIISSSSYIFVSIYLTIILIFNCFTVL